MSIIELIGAALGGGVLLEGVRFFIYRAKRKDDRSDSRLSRELKEFREFEQLLDDYKSRMQGSNEEILEWSKKYLKTSMKIDDLERKIADQQSVIALLKEECLCLKGEKNHDTENEKT